MSPGHAARRDRGAACPFLWQPADISSEMLRILRPPRLDTGQRRSSLQGLMAGYLGYA